MKKQPLSLIEISKKNLVHNITQFRHLINNDVKIAAVVKANAYGHGDLEVVATLDPHVDYFQVNSLSELTRIRKITAKEVFVFGYVFPSDIAEAIELDCTLSAFDLQHLKKIDNVAGKLQRRQKVHIVVDAHLGREGILPSDIEQFLKVASKLKNILIDGVYAHFSNIEDTEDFSHAAKQLDSYKSIIDIFKNYGYEKIETHISATSGILDYEKNNGFHSIVRVGIGLYGMWPSSRLEKKYSRKISLLPVLRWVTHVAQVKMLPADHSIGYGLSYITKQPTLIAVIPQGYSDGLPRILSNKGSVLIGGKRAPILGRIAMNMFVVDVTAINNVAAGDEVVLLGRQGDSEITAEELAEMCNTINYEITARINPLLPRII